MSGPLEELRAALSAYDAVQARPSHQDDIHRARGAVIAKARALLAASGTEERPADEGVDVEALYLIADRVGRNNGGKEIWAAASEIARLRAAPTPPDAGTGEPPATAKAWLHSDPGRCNHVETGHMGRVPSCKNPQGEWIPLVPDAGTGTPSDDGRRFGLDDVGDATSSATILPTDWDEDEQGEPPWCAVTYRFAAEDPESTSRVGLAPEHWVWELVTGGTALLDGTASYDNPAPTLQRIVDLLAAAPSGTTGATRGGPSHREPADGEEAVQALHAGVLERNMDGIPHGPGGWWPCKLTADAVRQGLGRFRIPIDWTPPTTGATTGDES